MCSNDLTLRGGRAGTDKRASIASILLRYPPARPSARRAFRVTSPALGAATPTCLYTITVSMSARIVEAFTADKARHRVPARIHHVAYHGTDEIRDEDIRLIDGLGREPKQLVDR